MNKLNVDDISRFLDEIPDDGDINSDFDDDFETLDEDVISPLDLYNNVDEVQDTVDIDLDICEFVYAVDGVETINLNENDMLNNEAAVVDDGKNVCKTKNSKSKIKKSKDVDFVYVVDGDETINLNENDMLNNEAVVVDEGKNVCKTKKPKGKITKSKTKKSKKSNDLDELEYSDDDQVWARKTGVKTVRPEYLKPEGAIGFDMCNTPTDVFMVFMESILDDLVYQTNLYRTQNNKTLRIQREDMLIFIGINFFMGYHSVPSYKDYWSTSPDLGVKEISVDESMIKFKGRSSIKQYNPMKPIKRGYKIWSMADQKGYMLAFKVYQGKEENVSSEFENYGLGERVVLELTKSVWNEYREIYFDNYFSSPKLLQKLHVERTLGCGTIRANRKGLPNQMILDKKMSRGDSDIKYLPDGVSFIKWMDNKAVHFISNFHGSEITNVNRKNKDGSSVSVKCPASVSDYNKYMGGVDHADRLRALYNIERKSRKWWHRLFFGLLDIMFVNSYVVYCSLFGKMSVLEYRRSVVQGLLTKQTLGKKRPSTQIDKNVKRRKNQFSLPQDVRTGNRGIHWPTFVKERRRCEMTDGTFKSRP
ncbi:uncharacterized protein LOC111036488 [Myzus persicae]|uniref:uncharacterized protein LOC111036488 n=1 Tax=Myzus persicae TaxID=13164 RepID=UPI000B9398EE|nr:uncharacterized protein LOC111036488 [Myzus persicae]